MKVQTVLGLQGVADHKLRYCSEHFSLLINYIPGMGESDSPCLLFSHLIHADPKPPKSSGALW